MDGEDRIRSGSAETSRMPTADDLKNAQMQISSQVGANLGTVGSLPIPVVRHKKKGLPTPITSDKAIYRSQTRQLQNWCALGL